MSPAGFCSYRKLINTKSTKQKVTTYHRHPPTHQIYKYHKSFVVLSYSNAIETLQTIINSGNTDQNFECFKETALQTLQNET